MMQAKMILLFLVVFALEVSAQTTWHVSAGAPPGNGSLQSPFASIQQAIQSASPQDVILVTPGTYFETIDFLGKNLAVRSTGGAATTIIDAGNSGAVVSFTTGESASAVISGFTLTHGMAPFGGGVHVFGGASPSIDSCVIVSNTAVRGGGGLCIQQGGATVVACRIAWNTADFGAGVNVEAATSLFERCLIENNTANGPGGGVYCQDGANAQLLDCVLRGNVSPYMGGGLLVHNAATVQLINGLVVGNAAPTGAGGAMAAEKFAELTVTHSTIAHNVALFGAGLRSTVGAVIKNSILWGNAPDVIDASGSFGLQIAWCDVEGGWPGTGNIDADPLFVLPAAVDYHLHPASLCVDAGTSSIPLPSLDIDGDPRTFHGTPDMGVDETILALTATRQNGPGGPIVLTNWNLTAGREYWNVFSFELCPTPSAGPYLGLCASDPAGLLAQVLQPAGAVPFHFFATQSREIFGPYAVSLVTVESVTIEVTQGSLSFVSPVTRWVGL